MEFKKLKVLPFLSQYILSFIIFVINSRDQFFINSEMYGINTRFSPNLHLRRETLTI